MACSDKIKARIAPSSLISQYVKLKPKGGGEFLGLCPFHQENTPSFTVSDVKGFYYCFGCAAHGDIFSFIMDFEGLDYKTALEKLAAMAGVELEKKHEQSRDKTKEVCYAIFEEITKFYQNHLYSQNDTSGLDYLCLRKIKTDIIALYRLGLAPYDSSKIFSYLKKRFTLEEIALSSVFGKDLSNLKDLMRGRVIFPIFDRSKRVIAFGGRLINSSHYGPKYINSSENPLFHKGDILYGLHEAEKAARKAREIFVVEGYMDVLALAGSGFKNAVAPLGTSFKKSHVELLWNISKNPIICFDSDNAGLTAQKRIALEVLPDITPQKSLQFLMLKDGKDIDEVINKFGGDMERLGEVLNSSVSLVDFLFATESSARKLSTPESQVEFKNTLINLAASIKDKALSIEYRRYFLDLFFKKRYSKFNSSSKNVAHSAVLASQMKFLMNKENSHIMAILCVLLKFPELLNEHEIYDEFVNFEAKDFGLFSEIRDYVLQRSANNCNNELDSIKGIKSTILSRAAEASVYIGSSIDEARAVLTRAFRVHSLLILRSQIEETQQELLQNPSDELMSRLLQLKSYELRYKNELKIA
ncbi:MAG: DNA primase [Candidatus Lariskella arthropodorum]|uniref:DNA primase n=1 Tax=Candidatus Lariskella endosymbiont of Epinotia ramella TaxID=3066224 RepID=UPI0030CE16C0